MPIGMVSLKIQMTIRPISIMVQEENSGPYSIRQDRTKKKNIRVQSMILVSITSMSISMMKELVIFRILQLNMKLLICQKNLRRYSLATLH